VNIRGVEALTKKGNQLASSSSKMASSLSELLLLARANKKMMLIPRPI